MRAVLIPCESWGMKYGWNGRKMWPTWLVKNHFIDILGGDFGWNMRPMCNGRYVNIDDDDEKSSGGRIYYWTMRPKRQVVKLKSDHFRIISPALKKQKPPARMDLHASAAPPHSKAELQIFTSPTYHPLVVTSHLVEMSS